MLDNVINFIKNFFIETDEEEKFPNDIKNRNNERIAAEARLTEYLAEEQKRKQKVEDKRFAEIQSEKNAEEDRARQRRENEIEVSKKLADKNRIQEEEIERQRLEQLKIWKEQTEEKDRLEKVRAEEQRQLNEIRAEEQRIKAEEQRKLDEIAANERKIVEKERLILIHGLYEDQYREYLKEAEKFRHEFGKNVQCDVCGKWDGDLYVHLKQTYCEKCKPAGIQREHERKVIAGKHGASCDFIKK